MKILSVGALSGLSNTCLHRNWALHKIAEHVDEVKTDVHPWSVWCKIRFHLFQLGLPVTIPDNNGENETICSLVSQNNYDIVATYIYSSNGFTYTKGTAYGFVIS